MKGKKILSAFIALVLIAGMPVTAFAADWYIDQGDITITADENGQNVSQGGGEAIADSDPVISGTSDSNTITIIADAGATANVTLDGVNIDVSNTGATGVPGKAGISTKGDGNVTIELEGDNTVKSGNFRAGVEKNNGGNLTIKDDSGKDGSLAATGGEYGAGIGGSDSKDGNNITISGGTINATGGIHGAGIGGGNGGNGNNITISGGTVNATGNNGAGIGGGESSSGVGGNGSNITISGGNVTASSGGWYGAGIGGGSGGNGSDITISDGTVDSTGGKYAAGIGGGQEGNGSNIEISGGNITAVGGESAAGIGGGIEGSGSKITVSGDANVKVKGGDKWYNNGTGAAIGDGGTQAENYDPIPGDEIPPDTSKLTEKGKIEYYDPKSEIGKDKPRDTTIGSYVPPEPEQPEQPAKATDKAAPALGESAPLYRVTDKDGKDLTYKYEKANGVLTVTVEADYAVLTGSLSGINTLSQQGIEELVFVTNGASSTYKLAELLDMGSLSDSYALTHDGETATLAVG